MSSSVQRQIGDGVGVGTGLAGSSVIGELARGSAQLDLHGECKAVGFGRDGRARCSEACGGPKPAGYGMWMNLATLGVPSAVMAKSR